MVSEGLQQTPWVFAVVKVHERHRLGRTTQYCCVLLAHVSNRPMKILIVNASLGGISVEDGSGESLPW